MNVPLVVLSVLATNPTEQCAASGSDASLYARVAVTQNGAASSSWTDYAIHGAAADALVVCRALVGSAGSVTYPASSGLKSVVVRDCSSEPLPVSQSAIESYALVQPAGDPLADLLLSAGRDRCLLQRAERVRVVQRRISVLSSVERCQDDLQLVNRQRHLGQKQSQQAALQWLNKTAKSAQQQADLSCQGRNVESASCQQNQQMVELLLERRHKMAAGSPAPEDELPFCIPAQALVLYSLLTGSKLAQEALLYRVVDAAVAAEMQNQRYGAKHPKWRTHHQKLGELARQALVAPRQDPESRRYLAEKLDVQLSTLGQKQQHLLARYGAPHPAVVAVKSQMQAYRRWRELIQVKDITAEMVESPFVLAEQFLKRAVAEGRLEYLEQKYLQKHPKMVAAAANLEILERRLASYHQLTEQQCMAVKTTFRLAISIYRTNSTPDQQSIVKALVDHQQRLSGLCGAGG